MGAVVSCIKSIVCIYPFRLCLLAMWTSCWHDPNSSAPSETASWPLSTPSLLVLRRSSTPSSPSSASSSAAWPAVVAAVAGEGPRTLVESSVDPFLTCRCTDERACLSGWRMRRFGYYWMEHGLLLQRTIGRGRHCQGRCDDIAIALPTPGGFSARVTDRAKIVYWKSCVDVLYPIPRVLEGCGCGNDGTAWSLSDYPTQRNLFFPFVFWRNVCERWMC